MMKTKLLIGALAIAGLIGSPLAADAKSKKHVKHHGRSRLSLSQRFAERIVNFRVYSRRRDR